MSRGPISSKRLGDGEQAMTWHAAYRIADDQIAYWQRSGVTAREAEIALLPDYPTSWFLIRQKLARWVMAHRDRWED